jgi:hypothetical protein
VLPRHPPDPKQKTPAGCEAEGALATNWTRSNRKRGVGNGLNLQRYQAALPNAYD